VLSSRRAECACAYDRQIPQGGTSRCVLCFAICSCGHLTKLHDHSIVHISFHAFERVMIVPLDIHLRYTVARLFDGDNGGSKHQHGATSSCGLTSTESACILKVPGIHGMKHVTLLKSPSLSPCQVMSLCLMHARLANAVHRTPRECRATSQAPSVPPCCCRPPPGTK
jgi:hypothetical protein